MAEIYRGRHYADDGSDREHRKKIKKGLPDPITSRDQAIVVYKAAVASGDLDEMRGAGIRLDGAGFTDLADDLQFLVMNSREPDTYD